MERPIDGTSERIAGEAELAELAQRMEEVVTAHDVEGAKELDRELRMSSNTIERLTSKVGFATDETSLLAQFYTLLEAK